MHNVFNMRDLLEYTADIHPQKIGFTFFADGLSSVKSITYGQLTDQVKAIAACLQTQIRPGDRIVLLLPPGQDFIIGFFACLYAGAIAVPCFPPVTLALAERLQNIIESATPECILTNKQIYDKIKLLKLAKFADQTFLAKLAGKLMSTQVQQIVSSDFFKFTQLPFALIDKVEESTKAEYRNISIAAHNTAFLQYTSGTINQPKGVMVSHANLLENLQSIREHFDLNEEEVGVGWLPPYHDMGLIGAILSPIYNQFHMYLMSPPTFLKRPFLWLKAISDMTATTSLAPNFAYDLCVKKISEEELSTLNLKSWHKALNGAEPIRKSTLENFANYFAPCGFNKKAFMPCYGLAEATLVVTSKLHNEEYKVLYVDPDQLTQNKVIITNEKGKPLISSGKVDNNHQLRIVNTKNNTICEEMEIGEIWVKGPSITQGYWNLDEGSLNQDTFSNQLANGDGPFLRTGDLGFVKAGELYVTGRAKDLIIINGKNHYPHDIELTIESTHEDIYSGRCAVFAIEENDQEAVVALIELRKAYDAEQSREIIDSAKAAVLKEHGIAIQNIVIVPTRTLCKTTSGKTQRNKMRELYLNNQLTILHQSVV